MVAVIRRQGLQPICLSAPYSLLVIEIIPFLPISMCPAKIRVFTVAAELLPVFKALIDSGLNPAPVLTSRQILAVPKRGISPEVRLGSLVFKPPPLSREDRPSGRSPDSIFRRPLHHAQAPPSPPCSSKFSPHTFPSERTRAVLHTRLD